MKTLEDFCDFLEYEIGTALENLKDDAVKGFWCDGVLLSEPDLYYSQKYVNDKRQITLKAFVGKTGQEEYELTVKFGPVALSRYARGLDISVCVRPSYEQGWFTINPQNKKIEIILE